MPKSAIPSHPVLSPGDARALEAALFGGDEGREWTAMRRAGRVGRGRRAPDLGEAGGFPEAGRVLVLAGKGNNAGDALIAAREILEQVPGGGR